MDTRHVLNDGVTIAVAYPAEGPSRLRRDYDGMRFVANWGKSYGTKAEYKFRQKIFETKDKELQEINSDPTNTFTVDHNKFSDWTAEEYGRLLGYRADDKLELEKVRLLGLPYSRCVP